MNVTKASIVEVFKSFELLLQPHFYGQTNGYFAHEINCFKIMMMQQNYQPRNENKEERE